MNNKPLQIVAELSGNHNKSQANLFKLITKAKQCGATSLKIQCFKPETITANSKLPHFLIKEGPWKGATLFELYNKTYLPWEWYDRIFKESNKLNIEVFGSVFDEKSADFLSKYNSNKVKIASPEIIDLKLIEYVSKRFNSIIISTGMASKKEIIEASKIVKISKKNLTLLQCVSEYPAKTESYNLNGLNFLKSISDEIGISDHTLENTCLIGAIALGSTFVEKHLTLDRNDGGIDSHFSLEPNEFKKMAKTAADIFEATKNKDYDDKNSDSSNRKYRRSLFYKNDKKSGDIISENDVKCIRPGLGLYPSEINKIIGKILAKDVKSNYPIKLTDFIF